MKLWGQNVTLVTSWYKIKTMINRVKSQPSRRRRVLVSIALVVLLGIGAGTAWHYYKTDSPAAVAKKTQTSENAPNEARKGSSKPATTLTNGSTAAPAPTPSAGFTVQIVNADMNENNSNLHVGTMVNNTTSGSCSLTATQAGQTTLQLGTSSVVQDVNSYDCGVFNIPTSEFPTSGNWLLTLTVTNNGTKASGTATAAIPGE